MDGESAEEKELENDMITPVEIKTPELKVLCHKNVLILDREVTKLCKNGWYPVGGVGRKGNDWVQVIVRERKEEKGWPLTS